MRAPADCARRRFAQFSLAEFDDVPRARFVGHLELVARFGRALQAENFDRRRGPRAFHRAPVIVEHRADLAVHRAADENIAGVQRSGLHQNRRHRRRALCPRGIPARCPRRAPSDWISIRADRRPAKAFRAACSGSSSASRKLPPSRCLRPIPRASGRARKAGA